MVGAVQLRVDVQVIVVIVAVDDDQLREQGVSHRLPLLLTQVVVGEDGIVVLVPTVAGAVQRGQDIMCTGDGVAHVEAEPGPSLGLVRINC